MKPILFNTEMVRAILDGRKMVTRRIVKPQYKTIMKDEKNRIPIAFWVDNKKWVKPPYQVGDILYVRETWRVGAWNENISSIAVDYLADGHSPKNWIQVDSEAFEKYWIQSSDDAIKAGVELDAEGEYHWECGKGPTRWRPSIHMPKEAARIFLKVTGVRVEHLQEITEEQAFNEGVPAEYDYPFDKLFCPRCKGTGIVGGAGSNMGFVEIDCPDCDSHVKRFKNLWNSTVDKADLDQFGWDANCWVWVIEFERCEKPESEVSNEKML